MTAFRNQRLEILTPEGVLFGLPLAGPIVRLLAWIIDALLIGAGLTAAGKLLALMAAINSDWYAAAVTIALFVISAGYGMFFEWWWGGQTPGKRILRLRVVDEEGLKLEFHQVAIRNIMRGIDSLPLLYLIGGAACLLSRNGQRLGDMAANTVVIRQSRLSPVDPAVFAAGRYNSLLDYPHIAAVLRQRASPALVDVSLQGLDRRNELSPEAQAEIFGELAVKFRELAKVPEDIQENLTDEQFVRGVLEVVTSSSLRRR